MALFAIIAPGASLPLGAAIEREFPGNYFAFGPGQYAVSVPNMTTQEVSHKLSAAGELGHYVVFPLTNWWGWHRKDLWEWLYARANA